MKDDTRAIFRRIVALFDWDEHGPKAPVPPFRWKTVAQMSADLARAGLGMPLPPKAKKRRLH